MTLCCEGVEDIPGTAFGGSPRDSIENFRRNRAEIIAESVRLSLLGDVLPPEHSYTAGCRKCANYISGEYGGGDGLIHYVNLSMYPAPCQCKCVYCDIHSGESGRFNRELHGAHYKMLFEVLGYAKSNGRIAANAVWQISSGEITIHPYKSRIIDLVKHFSAVFYTNCFIFDKDKAKNLNKNLNSAINLSIDSGTPATWHKVKGVDNFETVTENLAKYRAASTRPGQISLKYIVLPGINDNLADYNAVAEIMGILGTKHLTIARDTNLKYSLGDAERKALISAAARLVLILHKNSLTFDMFTFTPQERDSVIAAAKAMLRVGDI
jgi:pyruvate-formate lyase-activating enzyme